MTYKETLDWMFSHLPMYQRIGSAAYKADLQQTIDLLNLLGNPQRYFQSVHIAGTNGKGSVSHLLASVFQEAGYKTALYTSPHLKDFRERIRINGEMIPEDHVIAFIQMHQHDFEQMQLSFFEMTVGMAFDYFAANQVDVAIVETGMGGRLDSTNLVHPLLSIITNIGLDHTQFLGDTRAAIAIEKAGIIKPNVPVIIGETHFETETVFEEKALEMEAPLQFADKDFDVRKLSRADQQYQYFDVWRHDQLFIEQIELPLMGHYQKKNLITVMAALDQLKKHFDLDEATIRGGIREVVRNTGLKGRWQVLSRMPLAIADTGHNVDGIREVVFQLRLMRFDHLHFVLGVVNDKDITKILEMLPRHATYYFCKADIPRAMPAAELAAKAYESGLNGRIYTSVRDAFYSALNAARSDDLVFVGGSTFVVAEVV